MILNQLSKFFLFIFLFSVNVAVKELVIKGDDGIKNNQMKAISNKDIIKNPQAEIDQDFQTKFETKKNILVSGSNYQNIIPNVGVRIQEEDKSKTGGLDFKNQFGRMSMKEYEMLRKKYAQNNESYSQKNNYNYENNYDYNNNYDNIYNNQNKINENEKWKRSETYDNNKHYQINNINQNIDNSNNNIPNNMYSNYNKHINNIGLKHYDWSSDEKNIMPEINNNYNLRIINQNNINSDNNGNKVLNENLFKRSTKKKRSIYGQYYSDKGINNKINKEKAVRDINYFNNQIMQNKNWGNVNSSYKIGRTNFSSSIKKSDGMNMRTRKKI